MRSIGSTARRWTANGARAYLTREFFSLLGERLGDRVVLMLAENAGKPVAGALNLAGGEALYGRNWGCRGDWPFLHFELCYYRAIDWAIEHGLQRVEAGAQGRHKIQRGYLPKPTYSAHWIAHAGLRRAVAEFPGGGAAAASGRDGGAGGTIAVPQGRRGGGLSCGSVLGGGAVLAPPRGELFGRRLVNRAGSPDIGSRPDRSGPVCPPLVRSGSQPCSSRPKARPIPPP